ncbi:velvet factor-domain-containing protein [Lineolata rhizophorae]|uniref:Velvet factor-domain-containing protein n=1 Tax=Lineolata rhizophorae TaxID=578093 RepID=A0A6A6NTW5_9PEZI|nr:velvet factor-domain-containing protein [Lineolata rhizophorae]
MYGHREHFPPMPPSLTSPNSLPPHHNGSAPSSSTVPPPHHPSMMNQPSYQPSGPTHPGHAQPPPPQNLLAPLESSRNGKRYSLKVEQQPVRARMCGFGDKDRRPITPPPCIRLIIRDDVTGNEVDPSEVDITYFVLTVDLWSQDGSHEVNLVRHSTAAQTVSISTSTVTSFPPPPERPSYFLTPNPLPTMSYRPEYNGSAAMHAANMYAQPPAQPYGYAQATTAGPPPPPPQYAVPGPSQPPPAGMFTRNLIGSLSVNAFRLTDTENKVGFWFVLQDLSVRTEGNFRLKMNFVDVGSEHGQGLNTGKAPVLASCFSDCFQVYSAKKFPGVIESTPLSKAFAGQGIKIPIRKDGPKQLNNAHEYDNED